MLSVGAIRFEGKFCASKKGGIGRGGRISTQGGCLGRAGCRTNECMSVVKVINYLRMCQRSFCIPMGHSLYIQFNRPFPLSEVSLACETT